MGSSRPGTWPPGAAGGRHRAVRTCPRPRVEPRGDQARPPGLLRGSPVRSLLLRSYERWDELGSITGSTQLTRTGGLMVGRRRCRRHRHGRQCHTVADSPRGPRRRRGGLPVPSFRLGPDELAVHEPGAGLVDPESTVATHVELAAAAGHGSSSTPRVLDWSLGRPGAGFRPRLGFRPSSRADVGPGRTGSSYAPGVVSFGPGGS